MLQNNFSCMRSLNYILECLVVLMALAIFPVVSFAQSATENRHQAILRELQLTSSEEKAFWPVYEGFSKALTKVFDETVEVAYQVFQSRNSVSDELADEYTHALLNGELRQAQIHIEYQPQFRNVLGARRTARLFQFERRLQSYMNAEIAREFPLIQ